MVPYEAFLSEKPVVTTLDAGGPLEIVADGATGRVVAPEAAAIAGRAPTSTPSTGESLGRGGRARPSRMTWDGCIDRAATMKVAYFSPLPPSHSGIADYSALLLPALRERIERRRAGAPEADVSLYHVGNDPDAHGWIVDALRKRPGVVVMHEHVLHHLIAGITIGRGDGKGYLAAMERERGVVGRLLGLGVLDNLLPLLWETRPQDYPLCGTVLDLATGLIVHSETVERAARAHGYDGPIWRIPHPAWPRPDVEPAADRRRAARSAASAG